MVPRHPSRLGFDRRRSLGWLDRIFVAVASGPARVAEPRPGKGPCGNAGGRARASCYSKSRNAVAAWTASTKPSHVIAGMPTRATIEPTASAVSAARLIALLHIDHNQQSINYRFCLARSHLAPQAATLDAAKHPDPAGGHHGGRDRGGGGRAAGPGAACDRGARLPGCLDA